MTAPPGAQRLLRHRRGDGTPRLVLGGGLLSGVLTVLSPGVGEVAKTPNVVCEATVAGCTIEEKSMARVVEESGPAPTTALAKESWKELAAWRHGILYDAVLQAVRRDDCIGRRETCVALWARAAERAASADLREAVGTTLSTIHQQGVRLPGEHQAAIVAALGAPLSREEKEYVRFALNAYWEATPDVRDANSGSVRLARVARAFQALPGKATNWGQEGAFGAPEDDAVVAGLGRRTADTLIAWGLDNTAGAVGVVVDGTLGELVSNVPSLLSAAVSATGDQIARTPEAIAELSARLVALQDDPEAIERLGRNAANVASLAKNRVDKEASDYMARDWYGKGAPAQAVVGAFTIRNLIRSLTQWSRRHKGNGHGEGDNGGGDDGRDGNGNNNGAGAGPRVRLIPTSRTT